MSGKPSLQFNKQLIDKKDDFYTKAISVPIGVSDHNVVAIARNVKYPKPSQKWCTKDHTGIFLRTLVWRILVRYVG